MWKTRFEVSNNHHPDGTRHRNHFYSGPLPTVPRVREDSPSAIVRPSPPSSISNLEILPEEEEEEDVPSNEQHSLTSLRIPKQSSYPSLPKHQFVLPTIVESHDHESLDDKPKQETALVATNTNYHQVKHPETDKNERMSMELTLDKRIHELLQQRKTKSTSESIDDRRTEIVVPTTFKDISAFFENKAATISSMKIIEQKKILRAKRSLALNRQVTFNRLEIISSTNENEFFRQIKRMKTRHRFHFDSMMKSNNNLAKLSNQNRKTTLWIISLLLMITIFVYLGITKNSVRLNSKISPQISDRANNKNLIYRYGQFVRNHFVSFIDLLLTQLGQFVFRIDKYEYKNNIVYIVTSTYEHFYDWFLHNLFRYI